MPVCSCALLPEMTWLVHIRQPPAWLCMHGSTVAKPAHQLVTLQCCRAAVNSAMSHWVCMSSFCIHMSCDSLAQQHANCSVYHRWTCTEGFARAVLPKAYVSVAWSCKVRLSFQRRRRVTFIRLGQSIQQKLTIPALCPSSGSCSIASPTTFVISLLPSITKVRHRVASRTKLSVHNEHSLVQGNCAVAVICKCKCC